MQLQKFRWSKVYESPEEELVRFLESRNIKSKRSTAEEFADFYGSPEDDCTMWCAEGSFKLQVNEQKFSMQPGDAIRIPANNAYQANAGMSGCTYYISAR